MFESLTEVGSFLSCLEPQLSGARTIYRLTTSKYVSSLIVSPSTSTIVPSSLLGTRLAQ